MIVEHVRVYESPLGEVKITKDRAGWCFTAHGTLVYPDGTIEWDWSKDGYYLSGLTMKLLIDEASNV